MSIQVGQVERVSRIFHQQDFDRFAALSGDDNPIHVDPDFSARTTFGKTVAHGMLLYGTMCGVLGTRLPGPGTVQLEQELMFPSPTYVGEEVTVRVEVTRVQRDKSLADLDTAIIRPGGEVGCQGRTLVRLPGAESLQKSGAGPLQADSSKQSADEVVHKGLRAGQGASTTRVFTDEDLIEYASLTGDTNPVFADVKYATGLGLARTIVPGSLLGGMFSYLLGTQLPGRGTNYLKQRLLFLAPVYPGEEITAHVKVIHLRPEKDLVNLRTFCTRPGDEIVCEGEALVLVRDLQAR